MLKDGEFVGDTAHLDNEIGFIGPEGWRRLFCLLRWSQRDRVGFRPS